MHRFSFQKEGKPGIYRLEKLELYNQRILDFLMQSYGIIVAFLREGDSILTWKLQFPALGTIVSYLGNSRVLPWKLQFLMPETTVSRLETGS